MARKSSLLFSTFCQVEREKERENGDRRERSRERERAKMLPSTLFLLQRSKVVHV